MEHSKPLADLAGAFIIRDEKQVGVWFECPSCPRNDAGGVHMIRVPFHPDESRRMGGLACWTKTGTTLEDLSLQPSIRNQGACNFHGFITQGKVTW